MRVITIALLKSAVVLVLLLLFTTSAQAGGGRHWLRRHAHHAPHHGLHHAPIDAREWYPKYYGGFHSRALENIGVPTGDIGIRGNGFMMNPW